MSSRIDSILFPDKEDAIELAKLWSTSYKEYNTAMKVEGGYVVTNKFDPYCNDKITPITPNFTNHIGRSS